VFGLKKCLPPKKFTTKAEKAWHKIFILIVRPVIDGLNKEEQEEASKPNQ
jgi:hypothetical protein